MARSQAQKGEPVFTAVFAASLAPMTDPKPAKPIHAEQRIAYLREYLAKRNKFASFLDGVFAASVLDADDGAHVLFRI